MAEKSLKGGVAWSCYDTWEEVDEVQSKKRSEQKRWSRWYPKKRDDVIIDRWAQACSMLNRECRDCEYVEECQDLADRLIGCMSVPGTAGNRQKEKKVLKRVLSALSK